MNEAVVLAPNDAESNGLGELRALAGLASQRRSAVLAKADDRGLGLGSLGALIDELLVRVISTQTAAEFRAVREEVVGSYITAVVSFARLIGKVVPTATIDRVVAESFAELEKDFQDHGDDIFGTVVKEQAVFTIWTLRKTSNVIAKVASQEIPSSDLKPKDKELALSFAGSIAWTQFHLDCLLASIRHDMVIQLDVLPEIVDGLRSVVNAYGYAREGLGLREQRRELEMTPYQWDEEDQNLLDSSMKEMELQTPGLVWSEKEAVNKELARAAQTLERVSSLPHPMFGTHVREGVNIIKDWISNPNPKK